VIITVLLSPSRLRSVAILLAAGGALAATSSIAVRWGRVPAWRTALRTMTIGMTAMLVSLLIGRLFDL